MSATGLEVFDKTLQTTHIWLDEMIEDLGTDRHTAWHVLGAVLHVLRDRLPVDLSAHLSAELPLLVRGAYFDAWRPGKDALKERTLAEFLGRVSDGLLGTKPLSSIDAVRSVFAILARHLAKGQAVKVRNALPEEVRALWPEDVLSAHVL
ncbi:MAG TPA: DUF2267 domain-containing protein [Micropepsaceae bacterium]|nr:DUF2267 domain-containing protein [Micropepsaceae bacterium]